MLGAPALRVRVRAVRPEPFTLCSEPSSRLQIGQFWVRRLWRQKSGIARLKVAERRFGRVFERLALPGLGRTARFELLVTLGAAQRVEVAADGLHPGKEEDATTIAAKRVLVSGDRMLLERRAAELARHCEIRLGALDRALAVWGEGGAPATEAPAGIRSALGLR